MTIEIRHEGQLVEIIECNSTGAQGLSAFYDVRWLKLHGEEILHAQMSVTVPLCEQSAENILREVLRQME